MTTRSMRAAMDAVLARRPELAAEARLAQHRADFEAVWADLGYPDDAALKRRTFARLAPRFALQDARIELAAALTANQARDEHRRRLADARALGAAQGRALAEREHSAALLAALDRRIAEVPALPRVRYRLVRTGPL